MDWHQVKEWLTATSGLEMDALHVHAGILIQIFAALLLRRHLSSPLPWLVVLVFAAANELVDYRTEIWTDSALQWSEARRDLWNTMLLPTLLLIFVRYVPRLFVAPSAVVEASSTDPG